MLYSRQIGQLQEGTDQTLCQEDRHLCGNSWACGWIQAEEPRDKGTRIEVMLLWYKSGLIKSGPLATLFRRLFFSGSTNNFIEQITQQLSQTEEYPPQTISQMLKAQSLHSKELKIKFISMQKSDSTPTTSWTGLFTSFHILNIPITVVLSFLAPSQGLQYFSLD